MCGLRRFATVILIAPFLFLVACKKESSDQAIWIYTSLYKDTVADIKPQLEKEFPGVRFNFYQAGSEEVAAKVQAEELAGKIQADVLIFSDRFWFEGMAEKNKLLEYKPVNSEKVSETFRNLNGAYATVSHPVMVLSYNSEAVAEKDAPKTFKELAEPKWKGKVSSGSPLASGTAFTTVAFLSKSYGWEYFRALRANEFIAEGGNSGVVRRIQSKERPVGIVLMENILRLTGDQRIKFTLPEDGAVIQSNVLAIVKQEGGAVPAGEGKLSRDDLAKKVADWFFAQKGQEAMVKSFMYAAVPGYAAPTGAPDLEKVQKKAPAWTPEFLKETLGARESIKNEFSRIVF
jgi:iron(III) transport system substrate-binding protein